MVYTEKAIIRADATPGRRAAPLACLVVFWLRTPGGLMSIVRIGLAETKKFAEGYEAIFGKKSAEETKEPETAKRKTAAKKKSKKGKKK
jgi:hypothetical protein